MGGVEDQVRWGGGHHGLLGAARLRGKTQYVTQDQDGPMQLKLSWSMDCQSLSNQRKPDDATQHVTSGEGEGRVGEGNGM